MFIRAYLRASTDIQDATRAKEQLKEFAAANGQRIASWYIENESGSTLQRPELFRLLDDCEAGDILLIEQVDRLSRLNDADWKKLRAILDTKGVLVVALDLPTSHAAMQPPRNGDDFTGRMLAAINSMLMDMLAAVARKDYDDRRRRADQGIAKAKEAGMYTGRPVDEKLHKRIKDCLAAGMSLRKTATTVGCALSTVQRVASKD
ncbi:Site-specific DNA recombinase [Pseudomonas arsenicoxydans]|uniref:Site-specific DNA recombinase n=1 Tax=Pseudomonas arsenicoxydans TaxID=702115 RepID=A0A1H0I8R2_9PSED|nr:recombinase family protein [Pseudomonas arsenicoxydans]SDO27766.1 Site-specific DNA recombinase [Pseudomonas arsenicoxydans]